MFLYKKIYADILRRIDGGEFPAGTRLPPVQDLARAYRVSPITVGRAFDELKQAGYIRRLPGMGTIVCKPEDKKSAQSGILDKFIAAVLPNRPAGYSPVLLDELHRVAAERGIPIKFYLYSSVHEERLALSDLLVRRVTGIIFLTEHPAANLDKLSELAIRNMGMVFLGKTVPGIKKPRIRPNDYKGVYTIMEELFLKKHTSIAFFASEQVSAEHRGRFEGYCQALIDKKIPVRGDYTFFYKSKDIFAPDFRQDSLQKARVALRHFLTLPDPPSAIVCIDDITAADIIGAANAEGIYVPGTVSVTGFGGLPSSEMYGITTVAQDWKKTARHAVESILHQNQQRQFEPPADIQILPILLRRTSVAPFKNLSRSEKEDL